MPRPFPFDQVESLEQFTIRQNHPKREPTPIPTSPMGWGDMRVKTPVKLGPPKMTPLMRERVAKHYIQYSP